MISDSEKRLFADKGIVLLRGAVSRDAVARVKASLLSELDRLQWRKNAKLKALPPFQQTGRLAEAIKLGPEAAKLLPDDLLVSIRALGGPEFSVAPAMPQLLLSLPHGKPWSLENLNWHLDVAHPKKDEIPGIQAFVLIDKVVPHGGATLALAGSHRLERALVALREAGNFPRSLERPQSIDGVEVALVEMVGNAGDAYLMDMRVVHSPSINASKNIRMMATGRWMSLHTGRKKL